MSTTAEEIKELNELVKTVQNYTKAVKKIEVDWKRFSSNHPSGVEDTVVIKPKITIEYV